MAEARSPTTDDQTEENTAAEPKQTVHENKDQRGVRRRVKGPRYKTIDRESFLLMSSSFFIVFHLIEMVLGFSIDSMIKEVCENS